MSYFEKLEALIKPGKLGFYRSCEITICSLIDRHKTAYNLFTLCVFEPFEVSVPQEKRYLTQRREHVNEEYSLLVVQYSCSLEEAVRIYHEIEIGNGSINTALGTLVIPTVEAIPPTFVPIDSTQTVGLNRVLKNNWCAGSMVFEWFGQKSMIDKMLTETQRQKTAEMIHRLLLIDLIVLNDRIGNIIFQLPSQIAFSTFKRKDHQLYCIISFDERVVDIDKYTVSVMTDIDHALVGAHVEKGIQQHTCGFIMEETGGPYIINVMDQENNIPILYQTTALMQRFGFTMQLNGNLNNMRTITLDGNTRNIIVNSAERNSVLSASEYSWKEAIEKRRYQERINTLMQRREFVRYKDRNDRARGLDDLRFIMNAEVGTQVCLWDPYLSATDLLDTWYFTKTYGLKLRAITSTKIAKKNKTLEQCIKDQRKILLTGSNQYGINMEWRIQHGKFGFSFHDRFLILLPPEGKKPKAWSLGTSVNSFGKTHHILQLVSNPGNMADAFEELWEMLDDPSCQIWSSREVCQYRAEMEGA